MEKLIQKHEQLLCAIKSLHVSLVIFGEQKKRITQINNEHDEEYRIYRDSIVQRFEYSIDLFWKYIKKYLELAHVSIGISIPSEVIRNAYSLRLINENEAEKILEMIKTRNLTSHMYIESIAEQLATDIPEYYTILDAISQRLVPKK
jgi:nucleotidyltransferase substrate binding protein (TIGR01987 family)